MWLPLDFDQAHATTADRFQSFIVTEGGNIDTSSAARIQNRNPRLKLNDSSVNDSFRQIGSFSFLSIEHSCLCRTRGQYRAGSLS
jgi:hypothetical protein